MRLAWARVRDSLWFAPSVAVGVATLMAVFLVRIPPPSDARGLASSWLFDGGAEGARGVLTAIAGGLITVTGTIFSVTIVALQLASSQFTPRVLGSFMADRVNQVVLAVFIGTFTYTLLVLRTIRSDAADRAAFVPQVGVTVALALLLLSIGALVVFINHAAQSIRVSTILHRETARTLKRVRELAPVQERSPTTGATGEIDANDSPEGGEGPAIQVRASKSGYLQTVHLAELWRLSRRLPDRLVVVQMEVHVGSFAFPGKLLASVRPVRHDVREIERAVRDAFILGSERTLEHDLEFGLVEISDIALRALSPSVNDPTTAIHCIDRLTEVLAALSVRPPPSTSHTSPDGRIRLRLRGTTFERATAVAFDQIRHFGADNPPIVRRLLEATDDLMRIAGADALPPLRAQAIATLQSARRAIEDPVALAEIERLALESLERDRSQARRDAGGPDTRAVQWPFEATVRHQ